MTFVKSMIEKVFNNKFRDKHIGMLFRFEYIPFNCEIVKLLKDGKINLMGPWRHPKASGILMYLGKRERDPFGKGWSNIVWRVFLYGETTIAIQSVDFRQPSFIQVSE